MSLHLPNDRDEMDFPLPAVVLQNDLAILLQLIVFLFFYFLFKLLASSSCWRTCPFPFSA